VLAASDASQNGSDPVTKKAPPVPPENRSPKGPGDDKRASVEAAGAKGDETSQPEQRGRTGDVKQNTTHQGHQQDR
jgi:hypothetical protein